MGGECTVTDAKMTAAFIMPLRTYDTPHRRLQPRAFLMNRPKTKSQQ